MILLDTCALLWHSIGSENDLSLRARQAIENASELLISSISIWEIGIKVKKKDLYIPISIENFVNRVKQSHAVTIVPIDETIILESLSLDWAHKDPADRLIVGTARKLGISLITADKVIKSFYNKTVW